MPEYPDKELTQKIIGAAFEVHNVLGSGFLEKVYQNSLATELRWRGFQVEVEAKIPIYYKSELVGDYYADILVNGRIILELKAVNDLTTQLVLIKFRLNAEFYKPNQDKPKPNRLHKSTDTHR